MTGISIRGSGSYLPERIVENDEFTAFLNTSDEWIRSHTGIERRRIALDEQVWQMGALAAEKALAAANMEASQIDMILGATATSEYIFPSVACLVQDALGARNAFCMDVYAGCAGGTFALDMARRYLAFPDVKTVLLVGAERLSQLTNYEDRATCPLFGDGAGAFVVAAGSGFFESYMEGDGAGGKYLYARRADRRTPFHQGESKDYAPFPSEQDGLIFMAGHDVYRFATRAMPRAIKKACEKAGITPEELDLIIPHQANFRIIEAAARHIRLPLESFYINVQEYGNTSAASVMIATDECIRSGRLKAGDKVCLVGFGAGLNNGAVVFEYRN